jgi:hypothetical protein
MPDLADDHPPVEELCTSYLYVGDDKVSAADGARRCVRDPGAYGDARPLDATSSVHDFYVSNP